MSQKYFVLEMITDNHIIFLCDSSFERGKHVFSEIPIPRYAAGQNYKKDFRNRHKLKS